MIVDVHGVEMHMHFSDHYVLRLRVLITCISKGVKSRMFVRSECMYYLMNGFVIMGDTKSLCVLVHACG
jgi:hypothetical protein